MKFKFLVPIVLSIVIGFFIGKVFFNQYDTMGVSSFSDGEKVYFVELGIYSDVNELQSKVKNYDDYLYLKSSDGYHLYAGVTKNKKTADRIKVYYKESFNNIYVREKYVDNYSFLNILAEYDKICLALSNDKDLPSIEKIVISNYKEMILENGDTN